MTSLQSRPFFRSKRSARREFTAILSALLVSLTPLFAQQPAQAGPDQSSAPSEHQRTPVSNKGPVLSSTEIAQGAMLLHFTNVHGELVLKGAGRGAFEIAAADHVWFPAEAHLVNGVVVVSTSLVQQPTVARYSWPSVAAAVLFDRAGVPAAPFHTDK